MKVIITGATGFVGEGVLMECLQNPQVTDIIMINRRHFDLQHPKLKQLIVPDFFHLDTFSKQLQGYDACFYCAGISSVGMSEKDYTYITYDTTIAFAQALLQGNKGMTFCFISGSHTDSSEKGKLMWARIKGKTENTLLQLPFHKVYTFRPGGMIASAGQQNAKVLYKFLVKTIALFSPKNVVTLSEVGAAMINAVSKGYDKQILEITDIKILAK